MGLDQIHEHNKPITRGYRGASDISKKVDESALICWETCSPDIANVVLEFEDWLKRNEILAENARSPH